MKRALAEKKESESVEIISKILADRGTPRLVQDLMRVLKEIQIKLASNGYQNIFILVDEFENSLPPVEEHQLHLNDDISQRKRNKYMGTPQSIPQLAGVGFIITLRKYDWNLWQNDIKERVNKIENKYMINMESLSLEDSKQFLTHRLNADEFRISSTKSDIEPSFSDDAIKLIWEKSNGNPRAMLRLANTAFRKSVRKEMKSIEINLVE